jgi:hypothetical protein
MLRSKTAWAARIPSDLRPRLQELAGIRGPSGRSVNRRGPQAAELYDAKAFPSRIEQDVLPTEIETGSRVRLPSTLFHFCGPPDFPYTTDIVQLENPASNDTVSRRAKPLKTAVPTRVLP